jgi:hypothetical protein
MVPLRVLEMLLWIQHVCESVYITSSLMIDIHSLDLPVMK